MNGIAKVTMFFGLAAGATAMAYAGGQAPSRHPDSDGVQQAIRFERAKAAADARQARREANGVGEAAQPKSATNAKDSGLSGNGGVQAAIRFERAKDAAAARQARREANHPSEATTATATVRR
jgi:hypothetical protein